MRQLGEKKIFIIDNDTLRDLCKNKYARNLMLKMNHSKKSRYLAKQIGNLKRYIKRTYDCNQVFFDWDILESININERYMRRVIILPRLCGCCGCYYYKEEMYNNKICIDCYNDANAIPACVRCGGLIGLECNCD